MRGCNTAHCSDVLGVKTLHPKLLNSLILSRSRYVTVYSRSDLAEQTTPVATQLDVKISVTRMLSRRLFGNQKNAWKLRIHRWVCCCQPGAEAFELEDTESVVTDANFTDFDAWLNFVSQPPPTAWTYALQHGAL